MDKKLTKAQENMIALIKTGKGVMWYGRTGRYELISKTAYEFVPLRQTTANVLVRLGVLVQVNSNRYGNRLYRLAESGDE